MNIDVVNVHAPSGQKQLKDSQRRTLLTNLLQSNSLASPGRTIGNAHFLIGGDMNTFPFLMSQLLQVCSDNGSLGTEARTHEPQFAKHGDLCVVAGVQASTLKTKHKITIQTTILMEYVCPFHRGLLQSNQNSMQNNLLACKTSLCPLGNVIGQPRTGAWMYRPS